MLFTTANVDVFMADYTLLFSRWRYQRVILLELVDGLWVHYGSLFLYNHNYFYQNLSGYNQL